MTDRPVEYELAELVKTAEKDACRVRLSKDREGVTLTGAELKALSEDAEELYERL